MKIRRKRKNKKENKTKRKGEKWKGEKGTSCTISFKKMNVWELCGTCLSFKLWHVL
jgi:hypothetical protein